MTEQMRTRMGMDFTLKPLDTAGYHVATRDGLASITWVSASGLLIRDPEDILGSHFAMDIEKIRTIGPNPSLPRESFPRPVSWTR